MFEVTLLFSGSSSRHSRRLQADGQQPLRVLGVRRRVARLAPPPQSRLRGRADGGVVLRQVGIVAFRLFSGMRVFGVTHDFITVPFTRSIQK